MSEVIIEIVTEGELLVTDCDEIKEAEGHYDPKPPYRTQIIDL
jgi:hypothetical protein